MKVTIGDCDLYLGDCLAVLPTLGPVDAVVTDPPYELSDKPSGASSLATLGKFDTAPYRELVNGFEHDAVFDLIAAICDPYNLFCFCSNKQISRFMAYHEARARATTLLVWHKPNAAPFAHRQWRGDIEYCIHVRAGGAHFEGDARAKCKVTTVPTVQGFEHPTVKPLSLVAKYIDIGTARGHTVCDPFMGSGTTGVACAQLGRRFVGIESEPRYFDMACERISRAERQADLFTEPPAQTSLI